MLQAELTAGFLLWSEPPLGWSLIKEQEEPGLDVTLKKGEGSQGYKEDNLRLYTALLVYYLK